MWSRALFTYSYEPDLTFEPLTRTACHFHILAFVFMLTPTLYSSLSLPLLPTLLHPSILSRCQNGQHTHCQHTLNPFNHHTHTHPPLILLITQLPSRHHPKGPAIPER